MKNVLHNLSPSIVPDPRQTTQYFGVGLLTFAMKNILEKKIILFITEDQPLSFLLKTVYMLMSRHFLLSFFSRSKNQSREKQSAQGHQAKSCRGPSNCHIKGEGKIHHILLRICLNKRPINLSPWILLLTTSLLPWILQPNNGPKSNKKHFSSSDQWLVFNLNKIQLLFFSIGQFHLKT